MECTDRPIRCSSCSRCELSKMFGKLGGTDQSSDHVKRPIPSLLDPPPKTLRKTGEVWLIRQTMDKAPRSGKIH